MNDIVFKLVLSAGVLIAAFSFMWGIIKQEVIPIIIAMTMAVAVIAGMGVLVWEKHAPKRSVSTTGSILR